MTDVAFQDAHRMPKWLRWYLNYGLGGQAEAEQRKRFVMNVVGVTGTVSSIWWAIFYYVFDPNGLWLASATLVAAALTLSFLPASFILNKKFGVVYAALAVCGPFILLSYLLGRGAGIHLFLIINPIVVLFAVGPHNRQLVLLATSFSIGGLTLCGLAFAEPRLMAAEHSIIQTVAYTYCAAFTVLLIVGSGLMVLLRVDRAERALQAEYARSEALLYNLLPEEIAARLKVEPDQTIADNLPKVAILFADIVDFTPRAATLPPEEVVGFLNKVFRAFDELAEKHGLEKIKTIGDAYMVAAGMPTPVGDPVHRVAEMALDMQRTVEAMASEFPEGLQVRIGLHVGPVVAGVIGTRKLFYDVWGETVNTASRMESHGEPDRIQVTTAAKEELEEDYEFEPHGTVTVKGMGAVETWWLSGAKG